MTITELPRPWLHGDRRFRIVAEPDDTAVDWIKARQGRQTESWCELTVTEQRYSSGEPTGRLIVSSFGGEVWPSAWPSMFAREWNYGPETHVTARGRELLGYPPD